MGCFMNKKLLFISLMITLILSGCQKDKNSNVDAANIIDKMSFNEIAGLYTINLDDIKNNQVYLYGTCDGISKSDIKKLNSIPMEITLVTSNGNSIIFKKENVKWAAGEPVALENGFALVLTTAMQQTEYNGKIDQILFAFNNNQLKKDSNYIDINAYHGGNHSMSIIEFPIFPGNSSTLNKKYSCSYNLLDTSGKNRNLEAQIVLPDDMKKFIEVSNVKVIKDPDMEAEIKKDYQKKRTKEQIDAIKVYDVVFDYELKQASDLVFKPQIKLIDGKETQIVTPASPVCFFKTQTQENASDTEETK